MFQKEIWFANLDPIEGREQSGKRPVVIISGDNFNTHSQLKIVCPLTSKLKRKLGMVFIEKNSSNNLSVDSEVLVFQVRTIDESRFKERVGEITDSQLEQILFYLNEILTF